MAKPAKNTICLWYDRDAEEAARFYAKTFPDSSVSAVHRAPGDFPSGKKGDVLTVEFTVLGIPCLGLNGGPDVQAQRGVLVSDRYRGPGRDGSLLECDRRQRRPGERVRLVQGQVGPVVADHADRADAGDHRSRSCRGQARVRCDDGDGKDRHRENRGSASRRELGSQLPHCVARFIRSMRFRASLTRGCSSGSAFFHRSANRP